ncbi:membrane protein [Neisseria gonorrhoeae SK708]|nr:membrane protein [Neisseria gonorrhoeae SK708]
MVERNSQRTKSLREDIKDLDSRISLLNKTLVSSNENKDSSDTGSSTVLPKLEGPGIVVTLNDSSLWKGAVNGSGTSVNINDYVIHQQDIESVVNALWQGGAEAMTIQDQRVLFNSAVICIGNVLMLQGHQYSPPYKISAIGPVDDMVDALNNSPAIRTYKEYVSSFGLGWKVEKKENLKFPEASALLQPLRYASVLKELNK